jgi:hypothetical protein
MAVLVVAGLMDTRMMLVIATAITAERVTPGGVHDARLTGALVMVAGLVMCVRALEDNVSVWQTLSDARQMDAFQPMLDLGKTFAEKGATFERPIMNYTPLWEIIP